MGNQQQHSQIYSQIQSFSIVEKHSHFTILKDPHGNQYLKFVYGITQNDKLSPTKLSESKDTFNCYNNKSNSIFSKAYLKYRFEEQIVKNKLSNLPKLIAFGQQTQDLNLIACSTNKINFAIFQHPYKRTLKNQIQARISAGTQFEEHELLLLIKSLCQALSQYFQHLTEWNQQLLQRRTFIVNEDNIFIKNNGNFVVSDIISHLDRIEQMSKQQVTLTKCNRTLSMTNLHAKISSKKIKQKFFETNYNNLAAIIQSLIFKFQCFSQQCNKNSYQSQSLSTALQSHRGSSKNPQNYSSEFHKVLKQLRQPFVSEDQIINFIERILSSVHLPTPPQSMMSISQLQQKKQLTEISKVRLFGETLKLTQIDKCNFDKKRKALEQLVQCQNQQKSKENSLISQKLMNKRLSQQSYQNSEAAYESKFLKKSKSKLRLSLKKESQSVNKVRNNSVTKIQCLIDNQKLSNPNIPFVINQKNKQNNKISLSINPFGITQSINVDKKEKEKAKKFSEQILKAKLYQNKENQDIFLREKKKVFLKKPPKDQCAISSTKMKLQSSTLTNTSQSLAHLNPMSRKKHFNININKCSNQKQQKQQIPVFKTVQKSHNEGDLELIQNLSSIMSNQNNTISSYGIPATDQFKTQNSLIEEEGCVGFNQILQCENGENKSKQNKIKNENFVETVLFSPPCVKLSSYPSIEMVESISLQRPQQKIPQFLKQFQLPEKHLLALNNIILTQKDVIFEQSFEQSEFNSIRNSIPNILSLIDDQEISVFKNRKNSKVLLCKNEEIVKKQKLTSNFEGFQEIQQKLQRSQEVQCILNFQDKIKEQIMGLQTHCNSIEKQMGQIELTL